MKKLALFTTALAVVIAASSATPVFAAEQDETETVYPVQFFNELEFGSLSDYAVDGDVFAFAEGTKLYVVAPDDVEDRKLTEFDCGFEIINLDYSDGVLYLGNVEGDAYAYPDTSTSVDYEFSGSLSSLTIGNYTYLLATDGLMCFDSGNLSNMGTGFSDMKVYDGCAYAIKDNLLYRLDGASAEEVSLIYTDFAAASTVRTGNVHNVLLSDYTVKTVTVNPTNPEGGDTYCTEVDLSDLSGEYFKTGKTIKINGVRSALAIAQAGNATIIVMSDGSRSASYITLTSALSQTAYSAPAADMTGAYALTRIKLYSRPYMCEATEIDILPQGAVLTVKEKFSLNFIDTVFYKVSYDDNGNEVIGYVAANYLSPYSFSAEQNETETVKEDFTYDDDVQTVVIVLLIVALVIIAIAYLTVVGTRDKGKKKRRQRKEISAPAPDEE